MVINIKNKNITDNNPLELTKKEFWMLFLELRNKDKLTNKEVDVLSDFIIGEPKPLKGSYKTYVNRLKEKKVDMSKKNTPKNITLQININVT